MEDDGLPAPQATPPQQVSVPDGAIASLVPLDTDRYRMLNDSRAVCKNVSIPAWMAALAERQDVNCSQVLQEALRQKLGVTL